MSKKMNNNDAIGKVLEHRWSPHSTPLLQNFWAESRAWIEDCLGVLDPQVDAIISGRYEGDNWKERIEYILNIDPDFVRDLHSSLFKNDALSNDKEFTILALAGLIHHLPKLTR